MVGAFKANDMDVFVESIPTVLADFTCFAKVFNFTYNSDKVHRNYIIMMHNKII